MIYFASCGRPSQYGSWGMIEAMDQPRDQAYKYQAVQDGKMLVGLRVKALLKIMVDIHQTLVNKDLDSTDLSMKKWDLTIDFAVMKRDRNHCKWWFNHWACGCFTNKQIVGILSSNCG